MKPFSFFKKRLKRKKPCIFTFGREREIEIVKCYEKDAYKRQLRIEIIESLHDYLNENQKKEILKIAIENAIIHGYSGTWEYATSLLSKLHYCDTYFSESWMILTKHNSWKVRFRIACVLNDIPNPYYDKINKQLIVDKSKKVAEMAKARIKELASNNP